MNKKIITIALCSLLTLGLASCDLKKPNSSSSEPQSQVSSEEKQSSENKQSSEDKKSEETSKPSSSSEDSKPESSEPESSEKESSESKPDSSQPESSEPESSLPESSEPESSEPESSLPESSEPGSSEPTPEEPNILTVYFQNNWNWTDVSAYVWNSTTDTPEVAWPGTPLTKVGEDGEGEYKHDMYIVEIDLNQYDYVIFNGFDAGKGDNNQTPDISLTGVEENTAFYMLWDEENSANSYGSYTYTPSEDDGGDDTPTDPIPGDPSSSENTSSEPESSEPESSLPESSEPESSLPESSEPESSEPESSLPESSEPESSLPESSEPESSEPESSLPESSEPGSSEPTPEEPNVLTVYFQNNWKWSDVSAYVYNSKLEDNNWEVAWPGTPLTKVGVDNEHDMYIVEIDLAQYDTVIFNGIKDDGSGNRDQSPKISLSEVEENTAFYMDWNEGNTYGTYPYTPSEDDGGDDTPTDPIPGDPSSSENTSSEPESSEPESSLPESSEPESSEPGSSEPESSEPSQSLPHPEGPSIMIDNQHVEFTSNPTTDNNYELVCNLEAGSTVVFYADGNPLKVGTSADDYYVEKTGKYTIYINKSNEVYPVLEFVQECEKYTIELNQEDITETASQDKGNDYAKYVVTLEVNDNIVIKGDNAVIYTYTVEVAGEHTFYLNKKHEVTVIAPVNPDAEPTLYFVPNANWKADNARFAIYYWNNGGNKWADLTDSDGDGVYECMEDLTGYVNIIFCRMNPNQSANNWDNKWNQTADLTIPTDGTNCYTVKENTWDKGGGTWSAI